MKKINVFSGFIFLIKHISLSFLAMCLTYIPGGAIYGLLNPINVAQLCQSSPNSECEFAVGIGEGLLFMVYFIPIAWILYFFVSFFIKDKVIVYLLGLLLVVNVLLLNLHNLRQLIPHISLPSEAPSLPSLQ